MEFSPLQPEGSKDPRQIVDRLQSEIRESNGVKDYLDTLFERFMESRSFALLKFAGEIIHPSEVQIVGPELANGNFNAFIRGGLIGLSASTDMISKDHDNVMASSMEYLMVLYGVGEMILKEITNQRHEGMQEVSEITAKQFEDITAHPMTRHNARAMQYLGDAVYEDSLDYHRFIDAIAAEVCSDSIEESHFYTGFGFVLGIAEQAILRSTRNQ